jgi:hypothetical protein
LFTLTAGRRPSQRKSPAFRQGLPYSRFTFELAIHIGVLGRFLALTAARILLLLTGLLTTALLLLAGLLTRVLVLLARIILIGH